MNVYYITFRSVTHAQRGERALGEQGVRCLIQRTPKWMEQQGCGYCLRLRTEDIAEAARTLERRNIPLRKIYLQREDGGLEALWP